MITSFEIHYSVLTEKLSRSFFTKFFLYGAAFHLWTSFVLVRFDDDTHDDDSTPEPSLEQTGPRRSPRGTDDLAEEERERETEDGAPMFIPLTWSRLREGELYTASDPEWQTFVQLSKDRKKLQELRGKHVYLQNTRTLLTVPDELAVLVLESASSRMSQILGGPLSLTGFWLVHQFPSRAPPEYLRSGFVYSVQIIFPWLIE
jgi:hypothetical protein